MKPHETLTNSLHKDIPPSKHMQIEVEEASQHKIILKAPLKANSNHKGTVFGGSIFSTAVLAGWTLVSETLKANNFTSDYIVIQDSKIDYLLPIDANFTAKAEWTGKDSEKFTTSLTRKNLGRAQIEVQVICNKKLCAKFKGRYVAQTFN